MGIELILIDRYTKLLNLDNLTHYQCSKAEWIRSIEIKILELKYILSRKQGVDIDQQWKSKT